MGTDAWINSQGTIHYLICRAMPTKPAFGGRDQLMSYYPIIMSFSYRYGYFLSVMYSDKDYYCH